MCYKFVKFSAFDEKNLINGKKYVKIQSGWPK